MYEGRKEKGRTVNLRPLCTAAIALMTGCGFAYAAKFCGVPFYFAFFLPLLFLIALFFVRDKARVALCFFLALVFTGTGILTFSLRLDVYAVQAVESGEKTVEGVVEEVVEGDGYLRLTLTEATADGEETEGKVLLTVYREGVSAEAGVRISVRADFFAMGSPYAYRTFYADRVEKNIRYRAVAKDAPVVTGTGGDFFLSVRERIRKTLNGGLKKEQAALAYALTTGRTEAMDEGILFSARYGGVAHLFAVSGLHIGAAYLALRFLLKKAKIPQVAATAVSLTVLFFFCGICGFSSSALRAFLLCLSGAVCDFFFRFGDALEKTAFCALVLLLTDPVRLFTAGFQLSMAAYAGLVALSPRVQSLLSRLSFGSDRFFPVRKLLGVLAGTLSVQAAISPVMLVRFSYVSVGGLFLNLLVLPLFSLFFPILLASVFLSCLIPVAAPVLLFLPSGGLWLFTSFFAAFDFSGLLFCGVSLPFFVLAAYVGLLVLFSGRVRLCRKLSVPLACLFSAIVVRALFPFSVADDCRVSSICSYDGFCASCVRTAEGSVLLVNGAPSYSLVQTAAFRSGGKFEAVVLTGNKIAAAANAVLPLSFSTLYLPAGEDVVTGVKKVVRKNAFSLCGVEYVYSKDGALELTFQGVSGTFGAEGYGDFSVFSQEGRDGLIFTINRGILSVERL